MNINELESYKLSDAIKFHTELNPMLFNDEHMASDVREKLLEIANEFIDYLGINDLDIDDITLSGSNAAYTYTDHSDVDLHILIDMKKINNDDIYRELFTAKKNLFNDNHDIKIRGYDVELYVQDKNQPVKSLGEYSILNDKWIKFPRKQRASIDQNSVKHKVTKLVQMAEIANRSNDIDQIDKVLSTIKRYRQSGLDKHGEFGPENIAFKILRTNGIIDKLYNHRNRLYSIQLSLDEDWHPNEKPPGPESKPTMPQGTVRVDVSDLYDWYKIGTNISNLDKANPSDFGKGPPSTIMAFGSEEEEHKYINALKRLGLTTTDIDPVDPNQPKSMPRQKTDPTFNVAEDVKHSKNIYLWHGSRHRNEVLIPRQATDTGGVAGSNQNAIYATTDPKIAIAMGLTTSGSDTGMFPNDPQMVLFSGDIRKGQNVYLHKLPMNGLDGKPQFVQGGNSREFHSVPRVKSIKPVEIKEVPVNKYLNLIRRATPQDLELQKKYQNKDVDEGSMKDVYGEIQDEHWDGIVGYVINGLKKGISEERIELYLYKWAGKELFDLDEELEGRGFGSLSELVDHIQEHDGKYVNPTFDLDGLFGDDQENLDEVFDKPYKSNWTKSDTGTQYSRVQLPDGTSLVVVFYHIGDNKYTVEFGRNRSMGVTGEGDAQRIFATVLNSVLKFVKKQKPQRLEFSASKNFYSLDPDVKSNPNSRTKLYTRMVNRYTEPLGYKVQYKEEKDFVEYVLIRKQAEVQSKGMSRQKTDPTFNVAEASGYIPSESEKNDPRFKTALTVDINPDTMKKNAAKFGWKIARNGRPPLLMKEELVDEWSQTDPGIRKALEEKGYEFLANGVDQSAYIEPGTGWILKIFGTQHNSKFEGTPTFSKDHKMFFKWAKFCMDNSDNPFLPRFGGYDSFEWKGKTYLQIRQERLKSVNNTVGGLLESLADIVYSYGKNFTWVDFVNKFDDDLKDKRYQYSKRLVKLFDGDVQKSKLFYETLKSLYNISEQQRGWIWDMHKGNFMMRGKTPVIVDPWVVRKN